MNGKKSVTNGKTDINYEKNIGNTKFMLRLNLGRQNTIVWQKNVKAGNSNGQNKMNMARNGKINIMWI